MDELNSKATKSVYQFFKETAPLGCKTPEDFCKSFMTAVIDVVQAYYTPLIAKFCDVAKRLSAGEITLEQARAEIDLFAEKGE